MVKGTNLKGEGLQIKASDSKKKNKKSRASSEPIKLKKGRKKSGSTPETKEKHKREVKVKPLDPLREQLNVLVQQANARATEIIDRGLQSRALEEAKRSLKRMPTRVDDDVLFRSDLASRAQINRELARVHTFLNDYTSTVPGANDFQTKLTDYKGAFGGQWEAEYGRRYDINRISEDKAKVAFDIYRRVVERAGGWERAVGIFQGKESLIGYGSENLIIAIYDMVENIPVGGNIGNVKIMNEEDKRDFIVNRGYDIIDAGIKAYEEMASKQVADYDYGIVFDDEDTKARRAWFAWLFDNRNKLRK